LIVNRGLFFFFHIYFLGKYGNPLYPSPPPHEIFNF
jgi:hypothetical protein